MASKKIVSADVVRAWASEQGLTVGKRGRLAPEVREAFAEAHPKQKYVVGHKTPKTETVVAKRQGKPPVRRNVVAAEVRQAAAAAGVPVGKRGRLTAEVKAAFVLGTLSDLAPSE